MAVAGLTADENAIALYRLPPSDSGTQGFTDRKN
jgi:hypothetical protein